MAVEDDGGRDLDIAVLLVYLTPVVDKGVFKNHALGQEEGEAGSLLAYHKQTKLLAELSVVTLFGFLDALKVCVKLVLVHKAGAVNALKHLSVGVASPVCAGAGGELYGVALDSAGAVKVRTCAQVGKIALTVEGNDGILGQIVYKLDLIRLVPLLHEFDRLGTGKLKALKLNFFLADLAHLRLKLLQDFGSDGKGCVKVIVKAVGYCRTYSELNLRVQALYRLSEDMARRVTVGILKFGVFKSVLLLVHSLFSFLLPSERKNAPDKMSRA